MYDGDKHYFSITLSLTVLLVQEEQGLKLEECKFNWRKEPRGILYVVSSRLLHYSLWPCVGQPNTLRLMEVHYRPSSSHGHLKHLFIPDLQLKEDSDEGLLDSV